MLRKKQIQIFPSILSADFGRLADEARRAEDAGADGLHVDVMDGHFVPNISMGPKAVAAIHSASTLFLDIHLMIYHPLNWVEQFVEAGADRVIFHIEATEGVEEVLTSLNKWDVLAGLAFSPQTAKERALPFLDQISAVLWMTVPPGFGGQSFLPEVLEKVKWCSEVVQHKGLLVDIQVDGGIDDHTALLSIQAGATTLVAGTYLYSSFPMRERMEQLRGLNR